MGAQARVKLYTYDVIVKFFPSTSLFDFPIFMWQKFLYFSVKTAVYMFSLCFNNGNGN